MAHAEHVLEMLTRPNPARPVRTVQVPEMALNRLIRVEILARQYRDASDVRQRARALAGLYAEIAIIEASEWDYDHV